MGDPPTEFYGKNQYCLNPIQYNDTIEMSLMTCFIAADTSKDAWLPYGKFIHLNYEIQQTKSKNSSQTQPSFYRR